MMLSDVAVRRPVMAAVAAIVLCVIGAAAFFFLPVRELPDVDPPIVSVNTDKALAQIYRINDRSLAFAIRNNQVMSPLSTWSAGNIGDESGELVWEGEILIQSELNQTITTAVPITDAVPEMLPGVYVITAKAELDPNEWGQLATQWFVVSDLGLTLLSATALDEASTS